MPRHAAQPRGFLTASNIRACLPQNSFMLLLFDFRASTGSRKYLASTDDSVIRQSEAYRFDHERYLARVWSSGVTRYVLTGQARPLATAYQRQRTPPFDFPSGWA